jgi:hypothetical protein
MSGRGLCDELIPRPEESYRLWCVSNVCDHETLTKRGGPGPYRAVEPFLIIIIIITYIHFAPNAEFLDVKTGDTRGYHLQLKL